MKKTNRKLSLSRETVRALDHRGLGRANGGIVVPPTYYLTCGCNGTANCVSGGCGTGGGGGTGSDKCTSGYSLCGDSI